MFAPLLLAAIGQSGPEFQFTAPNQIQLIAEGVTIMRGQTSHGIDLESTAKVERSERPGSPVFLGYPHGPKTSEFVPAGAVARQISVTFPLPTSGSLTLQVTAHADAFAGRSSKVGTLGSTIGLPPSLQYDSIYDRGGDWLLSFSSPSVISPRGKGRFDVELHGSAATIVFKPAYVRNHLGYYLWTQDKPLWPKPIAGWCSWMAHLQQVTERDVEKAARFFSENLKPYGYDVIQIDDGYQRFLQGRNDAPSLPEPFADYWAKPNAKFPSGLAALAKDIRALGMRPGIWFGLYGPRGLRNQQALIRSDDGTPLAGPWVNYAVNGLDPAAREEAYIGVVRALKNQGWTYFKLDTLRHILYDSYRRVPNYWSRRHESMEQAFRTILQEAKKVAGSKSYVLACWGTIPELAGLPDGCRIGEDVGPDPASMRRSAKYIAQFQHLNNVVWLNDPDYMCLRVSEEQAQAWCTLTSIAGGHLMVSDPIATYTGLRLDALRRVGPPIVSKPLNVVPMDPDPEFLTLTAKDFVVLARFGWGGQIAREVDLASLGLGDFVGGQAFDFWPSKALGKVGATLAMHALNDGACQAIVLRRPSNRPRILATDRHLGQEAVAIKNLRTSADEISGQLVRGPGRAWSLWIDLGRAGLVPTVEPSTISTRMESPGILRLDFPEGNKDAEFRIRF